LQNLHAMIPPERHDNDLLNDSLEVTDSQSAWHRRAGDDLSRAQRGSTGGHHPRAGRAGWIQRRHQTAGGDHADGTLAGVRVTRIAKPRPR